MSSTPYRPLPNGYHRAPNGHNPVSRRGPSMTRDHHAVAQPQATINGVEEDEPAREEDRIHALLKQQWAEAEIAINNLFSKDARDRQTSVANDGLLDKTDGVQTESDSKMDCQSTAPSRPAARVIDDDYGDDEDDEEEAQGVLSTESPLKSKSAPGLIKGATSHPSRSPLPSVAPSMRRTNTANGSEPTKTADDVRKQLDEDKKAATETTRRNFQSMFYTLEYDREAMLEQQKLDELEREIDNEVTENGGPSQDGPNGQTGAVNGQGSLGSADLGASSLTLKHLIARIDAKRAMVSASDSQLRSLISEVRKGRSKWASEDKVGQEELYEAAEKVLMELKAMTEYAQPFLQRVSKREAPDYHNIIKHPMDIGTMLKKLKQLGYKSKKEFVDDLNLIWNNCLKYNSSPDHPFRKKAIYMRKETDKLTPLIPEVTIRDRAEVEAEERRQNALDGDDSDEDDAPIMASRGRKAPKKGGKGTSGSARKETEPEEQDKAPNSDEGKPLLHQSASHLRNEYLRADSEAQDGSSAGFSTPPPRNKTPMVNGQTSHPLGISTSDAMELDGPSHTRSSLGQEDADEEDADFKTWKQLTMKDRATAAAERSRLFNGYQLNVEEPAILRSKVSMRRWQRQQKLDPTLYALTESESADGPEEDEPEAAIETLAEGIEKEEDSTLPDYYNSVAMIPDLREHWKWATDSEGFAVLQNEESIRVFPRQLYQSPGGNLVKKMEANMKQMQDTRKICSKIGIVKQMQIQGQTYQNQFQKYDPQPFFEQDVGVVAVTEDGPLMAPWVNRAALQRSVGKVFYHAGFEDFQPSALDAATDVAAQYFARMIGALKTFHEQPREETGSSRFTLEERVLHTLQEHGLDLEALETYVKDDVDRLSTKLGVVHERMKGHYTDLLRPALSEHAGQDGAGAFNDGSEQFVGGDFADDMGEDYFGFRELGLAEELGLEALSVPFHLLQNRMHSAYQAQHQGPITNPGIIFQQNGPYEAITTTTVSSQIGLVQEWFRARLRANHDNPLVEDEDLPQKQRFPKPRLPPTGKISSPRKRPIREQQQAAKKKRKLEEAGGEDKAKLLKPIGSLRLEMPNRDDNLNDPEKDGDMSGALISPESITAP